MADLSLLFNNFSSGEVSPLFAGRGDTEFINRGARKLKNFIPLITGGVRKRPGTRYIGNTGTSQGGSPIVNPAAKLIPFYKPDGHYFMLEYTANNILFWDDEYHKTTVQFAYDTDAMAQLKAKRNQIAASTAAAETAKNTSRGAADAAWAALRDSVTAFNNYLANTFVPLRTAKLDRFNEYKASWGPLRDLFTYGTEAWSNIAGISFALAWNFYPKEEAFGDLADAFTGKPAQIISDINGALYDDIAADIDGLAGQLGGIKTAAGTHIAPVTQADGLVIITIEESPDGYTSETAAVKNYSDAKDAYILATNGVKNYNAANTTPFIADMQAKHVDADAKETDAKQKKQTYDGLSADLAAINATINALEGGKSTAVWSVQVSNSSPFESQYTQDVHSIVISGKNNELQALRFRKNDSAIIYERLKPRNNDGQLLAGDNKFRTAMFYAGRLWLGGSGEYPNRVWGSRPPDAVSGESRYEDFGFSEEGSGALAGDAIMLEENDMFGSGISWITQAQRLIVGTDRATWADAGEIPTPATFDLNIVEYAGAAGIQARGAKEAVLYVGRDRKTLRALVYQATTAGQGYVDVDLSQNAAHLFGAGIKDFDVASSPCPLAWIVLNDGTVVSATLDFRGGMAAFSRHDLGGQAESVAVARGEDGDVAWFVVNRQGVRTVEILIMNDLVNAAYDDSCYCDGAVYQNTPAKTAVVSGLRHLSGKKAVGLADGSVTERVTVAADGTAVFLNPFNKIIAGLPIESELVPACPEFPLNGTSLGKKRRVEGVTVRIYDSFGGKAGTAEDKLEDLPYLRYGAYRLGERPAPYTGDMEVFTAGRIDPEGKLVIRHDEPAPFTLLALVERVAVVEA
jgi:hypothetical protein